MPKIPTPLTELEFKEMARDCFAHGEISEWSAHRGWKNRSSGSKALSWKDEQELHLFEAYLDIYAARMVGTVLAVKVWDMFSRAVFPLLRVQQPAQVSIPERLSEVKLHFNNWAALEHAREDGQAYAEECEAARLRAIEVLTNYRAESEEKRPTYSPASHLRNVGT